MKRPGLFASLLGNAPQAQTGSRSRLILWISFLLAGIFLFLALKDINWITFFATLRTAQYVFLPVVFLWSSLSYFIRALRWRLLLSAGKDITRKNAFWANMSGYLGNNIMPARMGELVRATYASRVSGISISFALASGLSERLMDVVALVLLGAVSISLSGITSGAFQGAIRVMAMVAGVGLVIIFILPRFSSLLERIVGGVQFIPANVKEKLLSFFKNFLTGFQALLDLRRAAVFGLYTMLIWLMDGLNVVLMGYLLHVPITLLQAFVLLAGLGLSSAIPSTPGYVGVYQFVAVTVLEPFGFSPAEAVAFILVSQMLGVISIGFWGLIGLGQLNKTNQLP